MNHFPVLLLRNLHAPCASQARACVLCAKLLQCCCPRTWPARDPGTMQTLSSHFTLHSSHPTLHTSHLHFISTHLIWALLISFHVFPYVSSVLLGNFHVKYFPVLMSASFVVQSSTGKCFVLQSLHKTRSSTTLYYKACTKHFPVLLCTTKLAQTTSQFYFVQAL